MNVLLLGYGYWGKKVFSTLNQFKDLNIFVYDTKINHVSLDDFLIKNSKFDCVFIVTPEETHYELVKKFLLLNKHVFVEKPLCLEKNQAQELVDLAIKNKIILFVDYIFLYDNFVKKIKKLLDSKIIGKLQKIESVRLSSSIVKPKIIVTDDLMIHDLYLIKYLFDGDNNHLLINSFTNKDFKQVNFLMTLENSLNIETFYSWIAEASQRKLTISGQKGAIIWEKDNSSETLMFDSNKKQTIVEVKNKYSPLYKSIKSFFGRTKKLNQRYNDYISDVDFLSKTKAVLYEN